MFESFNVFTCSSTMLTQIFLAALPVVSTGDLFRYFCLAHSFRQKCKWKALCAHTFANFFFLSFMPPSHDSSAKKSPQSRARRSEFCVTRKSNGRKKKENCNKKLLPWRKTSFCVSATACDSFLRTIGCRHRVRDTVGVSKRNVLDNWSRRHSL